MAQADKAKTQPQLFRGELTLPEVKFNDRGHIVSTWGKTDEVVLKVHSNRPDGKVDSKYVLQGGKMVLVKVPSAGQDMQLTLGEDQEGKSRWNGFRRFVSAADIPAADSPDGIAKNRMAAAMKLAFDGKFDDARAAYDKIRADYPGTIWEIQAKFGASKLESIKEGRAKVEQMRKAQEEYQKKMGIKPGAPRLPPSKPKPSNPALPKLRESPARDSQEKAALKEEDGVIQVRNSEWERTRAVISVGPAGPPVTFDLDPSGKYLFASGPTQLIFIHRLPLDD